MPVWSVAQLKLSAINQPGRLPPDSAGEREGAADKEPRCSTDEQCGDTQLKHGRPSRRRVNLEAGREPSGRPTGAGYERSRPCTIPSRWVCPDVRHEVFHPASIIDRKDHLGAKARKETPSTVRSHASAQARRGSQSA